MQTLKSILASIFKSGDISLSKVKDNLMGLKTLTQDAPTISMLKELAVSTITESKTYATMSDTLETMDDLIDMMQDIQDPDIAKRSLDDTFNSLVVDSGFLNVLSYYLEDSSFTEVNTARDFIEKFDVHDTDWHELNIGTFMGLPVYFQYLVTRSLPYGPHNIESVRLDIEIFVGDIPDQFFSGYVELISDETHEFDDFSAIVFHDNRSNFNIDNFNISISNMILDADEGYANNQLMNELLSSASFDGIVDSTKMMDIIDSFGDCGAANYFRDFLSNVDQGTGVTLLSMISKYMDENKGEYEPGETYYTPKTTPFYSQDLIATILIGVVAIVAIVLMKVFEWLGAILSAIFSALSSLLGLLVDKTDPTSPHIKIPNSLLPTYNRVLCTRKNLTLDQLTADEIRCIDLYGACGILDPSIPGLVLVTAKSGKDANGNDIFFRQLMATGYESHNIRTGYGRFKTVVTSVSQGVQASATGIITNSSSGYSFEHTTNCSETWALQKSDDLLHSLTDSIFDLCWTLSSKIPPRHDQPDPLPSVVATKVVSNAEWSKCNGSAGAGAYHYLPSSVYDKLGFSEASGDFADKLGLAYLISIGQASPQSLDYESKPCRNIKTDRNYTWDSLTDATQAFRNCTDLGDAAIAHFLEVDSQGFTRYNTVPGNSAFKNTITWPTISEDTLINAIIIGAIAAITITAVSITASVAKKKRATARLAQREAKFEEARAAFQADPSKANLKAMNRANRRLDRAWTKAGKVGVSSYNGFSTVSNPVLTTTTSSAASALASGGNGLIEANSLIPQILCSIKGAL